MNNYRIFALFVSVTLLFAVDPACLWAEASVSTADAPLNTEKTAETVNNLFSSDRVALKEIGTLKTFSSNEIERSPISIGFECLDREMFDPEKCYDPLAAAGVKWARCQTGWSRCEKEKGKYDFAWLDSIVDNLLKRGIQPWFNVGFGNKLYMNNVYSDAAVGFVPLYYGDEALQAWKNYIQALAKHYKGRVEYFEIWNESNISNFWQPKTANPGEYGRLVRLTAQVIRAEIPDAKIGACVSGIVHPFSVRFLQSDIVKDLNFFSFHGYCVQPELNYAKECALLRRLLDENGGKNVALWQGEAGFPSWFPAGHWLPPYVLESERNQAVWMLRRYFIDFSNGIQISSFFQMADMMGKEYKMSNVTRKNPARHGILNGLTYTPKLSYGTMRNLSALFSNGTKSEDLYMSVNLNGELPRTKRASRRTDASVCTNTYVRNGFPLFGYHCAEDVQYGFAGMGNVSITVENGLKYKPIKKPVLIDMLTGKAYRIEKASGLGSVLLTLNKLPLTDSPLVICDEAALPIEEIPQSSAAGNADK